MHQIDPVHVGDAHQEDRQVARDPEGPQAGLAEPVAGEDAGAGAVERVGVNDRAGQLRIHLGLGLGRLQLAQHELAVRPGHLERARREAGVAILVDQRQRRRARFGHAGDDVPVGGGVGLDDDAAANRDDRIEHRAIRVGKRADLVERGRVGDGAAATDELGPVRFVGRVARRRALRGHQMEHPRRFLAGRARPARAENGLRVAENLGLHEQIAEGRVREVGVQRREDDFRVTGQLDGAGAGTRDSSA